MNHLFVLCLLLLPQFSHSLEVELSRGTAYDSKGKVVYLEDHEMSFASDKRLLKIVTIYKNPEGQEFARLTSDFSHSPYLPEFTFSDSRSGRTDGLTWVDKEKLKVFAQADAKSQRREKEYLPSPSLVAGQGLHAFVYKNLSELAQADAPRSLRYLIPMSQQDYPLRLRVMSKAPQKETARLRLEFDNWFMRLLAPSIEVEYHVPSKRLLSYHGTSNIVDGKGDAIQVRIEYSYGNMITSREPITGEQNAKN